MREQQIRERAKDLLLKESSEPLRWFYISYADEEGFRGAVIVEAHGWLSAVKRSRELGISPGGQALGREIPEEALIKLPEDMKNRLLTRAEIEERWN